MCIYIYIYITLKIEPISDIIHRLTAKFFAHCPSHPKPLVQQNRTLADLTNTDRKYENKLTKHILHTSQLIILHCPYMHLYLVYAYFCFTCTTVSIFIQIG
jgi:hypothetical protein